MPFPNYPCPNCQANIDPFRRSHRKGWEKLLKFISYGAYSCRKCRHRVYSPTPNSGFRFAKKRKSALAG